MKRFALQAGLVILMQGGLILPATAQGFNVRHDAFNRHLAGFGAAVEQNAMGEFVTFGNEQFLDTITGLFYPLVLTSERFSSSGVHLSEDSVVVYYKTSGIGWSNASVRLSDGRYVVTGSVQDSTPVGGTWIGLFWFEEDGTPIDHVELLGDSVTEWLGRCVKATPDGGFVIVGETTQTGVLDVFIVKTDSAGNVEWWQTYGHSTRLDYAESVDLVPGGGYYIGGTYPIVGPDYLTRWVLRVDSMGNVLWDEKIGDPWYDTFATHVTTTADGNVVFASGDFSGVNQNHWPQLAKLDTAGDIMWNKTYGFDQFGTGFFVVQEVEPFGDLIACGQRFFSNGMGGGYSKGTLLRTTANGDSLWMFDYAYYDSTVTDCEGTLRDVQPTPDGGFVAVGTAYGAINGNNPPGISQDVWVIKVDSLGCIEPGCQTITGLESQVSNLKGAVSVWPNPVASGEQVTVQVQLPVGLRNTALRLVLVNAQGQLVHEQSAQQGTNALELHSLSAGLYHVHLANSTTWLAGSKLLVE